MTLGKDIKLVHINNGKYDIVIENNDMVLLEEQYALESAIRVKLLTAYREMFNNPTYKYWGSHLHEHLKKNKTPLTLVEIKESIKEAIEDIRRVKMVDYIEIQDIPDNLDATRVIVGLTDIDNTKINMGVDL